MFCFIGSATYFKPLCFPGDAIRTEAWILRRLVTTFGQVTKRPHVTRYPQLRKLFNAVGIEIPETKSSSSLGYTANFSAGS